MRHDLRVVPYCYQVHYLCSGFDFPFSFASIIPIYCLANRPQRAPCYPRTSAADGGGPGKTSARTTQEKANCFPVNIFSTVSNSSPPKE
jgi:hypothetical protein